MEVGNVFVTYHVRVYDYQYKAHYEYKAHNGETFILLLLGTQSKDTNAINVAQRLNDLGWYSEAQIQMHLGEKNAKTFSEAIDAQVEAVS